MPSRSDRLIVGYDGSPPSAVAVEWAAAEAVRRRVHLTVLHAADHMVLLPGNVPALANPIETRATAVTGEGLPALVHEMARWLASEPWVPAAR